MGMREMPDRKKKSAIFLGFLTFTLALTLITFSWKGGYAHVEQTKDQLGIGINEKLGQTIPLDLTFNDENGNQVSLRQLIHTPTILAPVYFHFHCPDVCSPLLFNEQR
jgi:cytochrome oxidase Cu insertion factor (SCO1/SenC/PrrC family)